MKQWWDTLLSSHLHVLSRSTWTTWRHMFRSGGEAYFVALSVLFFTFNPYRHEYKRLHSVWQVPPRVIASLLAAIPLFIVIGVPVHWLQHWLHTGVLAPTISAHPSLADKLWADAWTTKLVVGLAAFIGRRPMFGVFAFVMEYFAEKRIAAGKTDHWWHTAPYRAMLRRLQEEDSEAVRARRSQRGTATNVLLTRGAVIITALALYGLYITLHNRVS